MDTQDSFEVSRKNSLFDKDIVAALKAAEKKYGMKVRMNSVICNNNFEDVKRLLELSRESNISISLGFVVSELDHEGSLDFYFTENDRELLQEIVDYILAKKKEGYKIIDPNSYFKDVFKFINHEKFWDCNYPSKYGWINVTPSGNLRSCTKKMDETSIAYTDLTSEKIKEYKESLKAGVKQCNSYCYSNCAYDSAFYKNNKAALIIDNFKKL
jgi:MoaA/NifB/PqqE/SkfB family radical SAM enzyme